jgi:hypothetical protein
LPCRCGDRTGWLGTLRAVPGGAPYKVYAPAGTSQVLAPSAGPHNAVTYTTRDLARVVTDSVWLERSGRKIIGISVKVDSGRRICV